MKTITVRELQDPKYILVTDPQECLEIVQDIRADINICAGCMLVEMVNGDYGEVWACERTVPYLNETAYQLK